MISIKINKKEETVTFSTLLKFEGKFLYLENTWLLYYAKPHHLNHSLPAPKEIQEAKISLFEEFFYWPEDHYTNSTKTNQLPYFRMSEPNSGYLSRDKNFIPFYSPHTNSQPYNIQWMELKFDFLPDNRRALRYSNNKGEYNFFAIPPNSRDTERIDTYIFGPDKNEYHYDSGMSEDKNGKIFIVLEPNDGKILIC